MKQRIWIATPEREESQRGNWVTARRWERIVHELGHEVSLGEGDEQGQGVLIALHALRSRDAIARFRGPVIVALTGTDLYRDIADSEEARRSLDVAWRLIVLQPRAVQALPAEHRGKARVIYQSVEPPPAVRRERPFRVCVVGHMREVKDPFRTAEASTLLSPASPVRVVHLGRALSDEMRERAIAHERANPRYVWLGQRSRDATLKEIARSQLLSLTSVIEGGANVVTEALACGTPIVSSRIDGSIGLLGEDYPGLFDVGDTAGLAALLDRAATDPEFFSDLSRRCSERAWQADPARERAAWRSLLAELD